ncbi:MAG: anaerobic ribonucleoside-triphosphate reductase activating protein [Deltaproteobacteria bacterium]|nr:anaerobic ribonucleoside-triphosphate reductase activating protein [Deltaproteobacteria bacterium]
MPESAPRPAVPVRSGPGAGGIPAGDAATPPPIKGFLETSFLDWRGLVSAVLFLPGCNFRCPFCHNFTLVSRPEQYQTLELSLVLERLKTFTGWIDGVVITGGEPTIHAGLPALIRVLRSSGFKVKLDTNGYRPGVLESLLDQGLLDMVAMDLKAPLEPLAYARAAGGAVDLERIGRSVRLLQDSGVAHEFRTTLLPAWHPEPELAKMAVTLAGARRWTLQAMNPATAWNQKVLGQLPAYAPEEMDRLRQTFGLGD